MLFLCIQFCLFHFYIIDHLFIIFRFIMETFNVSEIAIESGLFMKSLSDIESVAYCICDLLNYYEYKTGRYWNVESIASNSLISSG